MAIQSKLIERRSINIRVQLNNVQAAHQSGLAAAAPTSSPAPRSADFHRRRRRDGPPDTRGGGAIRDCEWIGESQPAEPRRQAEHLEDLTPAPLRFEERLARSNRGVRF